MDERLRELERQARQGGPEEERHFREAYDRAYGEGAYRQRQRDLWAERERLRQQEVVDEVEQLINTLDDTEEVPEEFWGELTDTIMPLLERGDINMYPGWAPGSGSQDPDILVYAANWNPEQMGRLHDLLEQLPEVELDWSDGVTDCSECHRAIQTQPDSFSWTPAFAVGDGFIWCRECAQENAADIFEMYRGDPDRALTPNLNIDPSEHGYINLVGGYETGFHPGQNDDPHAVAERLVEMGLENFFFAIEGTGQFDTTWGVWVQEEELHSWLAEAVDEVGIDYVVVNPLIASQYASYLLENFDEIPDWPNNLEDIELDG